MFCKIRIIPTAELQKIDQKDGNVAGAEKRMWKE